MLESVVFVQGNERGISDQSDSQRERGEQRRAKGEGKRKKQRAVSVRGSERMCVCVLFCWVSFFFRPNKKFILCFT